MFRVRFLQNYNIGYSKSGRVESNTSPVVALRLSLILVDFPTFSGESPAPTCPRRKAALA
jgi:hypothetical protein